MIKRLFLAALAILAIPVMLSYAATPTFTVSGTGSGNVSVNVHGGEINSPVTLYYNSASLGTIQGFTIGNTTASGTFSGMVNTDVIGINWNSPVYVQVGGYQSNSVQWPYNASAMMNGNNSWNTTTTNTGTITFSQASPVIALGQNGSVSLFGGRGDYYVASNSMTGVTPSISGSTLTLYGGATGSGSLVICSTGGGCGTLTATVQGSGQSGSPTLSSSNLSFNMGAQGLVTLSGGTTPYSISIPNGTNLSTTLIGNTLYVNGSATGTAMVNICSLNGTTSNGGCSTLNVNVQAAASPSTGTTNGNATSTFAFTLPLSVGQAFSLHLGGSGYYLQSTSNGSVLASVNNGNTLMLNGSTVGSGTVTVCQSGGACFPISFIVNPSVTSNTTTTTTGGTGGPYIYTTNLGVGATGEAVTELQTRLKDEGYFNANITGYFGGQTKAAVQRYQRALGITATGFVGVQTRAMLNQ